MRVFLCFLLCFTFVSCSHYKHLHTATPTTQRITGTEFYKTAFPFNWQRRDSFAVQEILSGNLPSFLKKFVAVNVSLFDSSSGKEIKATYYVMPDYLSLGTDDDWARVDVTPMAAQKIADSFHCFLPTRKMVDDIYKAAKIKLEPVPMYAFRDSTPTMYQHNLIIEGQRRGKKGLIAGIKKDVVISGKLTRDTKPNRVAIYGWHKLDGKPIQPLYTGHVNWYVDYSHGIRFIMQMIKVDGRWMNYVDVLKHPVYKRLLCGEEWCDVYKYAY
ncbi:hypothetical protein [Flavisolibacter ginsenosidimutans]|uniref:Uncharacterized protein n=1 Tax=Flavisolibacter ginsenosidimutans TaxID=661481 RepID=A0A5B8UDS5_9BACT|nr:hypothetical protein [Flavisolibacter ginsenosidimutans]QEC54827.1 hypothetical protein FSB75_02560 [Flavisolibacter ginsenosidimutans]